MMPPCTLGVRVPRRRIAACSGCIARRGIEDARSVLCVLCPIRRRLLARTPAVPGSSCAWPLVCLRICGWHGQPRFRADMQFPPRVCGVWCVCASMHERLYFHSTNNVVHSHTHVRVHVVSACVRARACMVLARLAHGSRSQTGHVSALCMHVQVY